jgi:hypothetical protein
MITGKSYFATSILHTETSKCKMSALSIEKLFGVEGYVALVTGGSSGLGLMICKVWEH